MANALQIKICGLTEPADAALASRLKVDAVGLNFYQPSPRCVSIERARKIASELDDTISAFGVFVARELAEGFPFARDVPRIRVLQWHGENRSPSDPRLWQLVPAFRVRDANDLDGIRHFVAASFQRGYALAGVLVDAHVAGQPGGTGQIAPWELLADFRVDVPLYLAGGLTPENVAEAIRIVRPDAVDVASGVESSPGRKDPEKMRRFVAVAREAEAQYYRSPATAIAATGASPHCSSGST